MNNIIYGNERNLTENDNNDEEQLYSSENKEESLNFR